MKFASLTAVLSLLLSTGHVTNAEDHEKGSYIVQMKDQVSHRRMAASTFHKDKISHVFKHARLIQMHLTKEEAAEMKKNPTVSKIEKDLPVHVSPTVPYAGKESITTLNPLGEEVPYGITMVEADDNFFYENRPEEYKKVCVVDTGYDRDNHDDLQSNNVDGYSPYGDTQKWYIDGNGHGTHCAGTINAIRGNGKGVVGVIGDESVPLFIGKGLTDSGSGSFAGVKAAVEACVNDGAKVISMSLGGSTYSDIDDTFYSELFQNMNILIVAASGNSGNTQRSYPASYTDVVSVGAVDQEGNKAGFSQYNEEVELSAPGVGVKSTLPNNNYAAWDGTSMATPHVAGVAALVWSYFPDKSAAQIRRALACSADDKGEPGRDHKYGHGIVKAKAAYDFIEEGKECPTPGPTAAPTPLICDDDNKATVTVEIKTDNYPGETFWTLKNSNNDIVMSKGDTDYEPNSVYTEKACLSCDNEYTFEINDSYGDGICCSYGEGYYTVLVNDEEKASGGDFDSVKTELISVDCTTPPPADTPTKTPTVSPTVTPSATPSATPTVTPTVTPTASPNSNLSILIKSKDNDGRCIKGNGNGSPALNLVDCSSSDQDQIWEYRKDGYLFLKSANKCLMIKKISNGGGLVPVLNSCGKSGTFSRKRSFVINSHHDTIVALNFKPGSALTVKSDGSFVFKEYLSDGNTDGNQWNVVVAE